VRYSLCAMGLAVTLSGCTLASSAVELSMSSMFSGAMTGIASAAGSSKHFDHTHPRVTVKDICVEYNDMVTDQDVVPAIQGELNRYHITSHVYAPGEEPSECEAILYYAAQRDWGRPMFSDAPKAYLAQARMLLRQKGGIVAQADYDANSSRMTEWNDTRIKIGSMVEELIYGGS